jgi:DNA-binding transcriptional regulator YhcF (GntR family)
VEQVDVEALVDLDPESPVPPFEQVREKIAAAIEAGSIQPAERLPPVRRLATDLGLAANTVARSYRELEVAGLLETRGRHGTFVAHVQSPTRKLAAREARSFARRMRELGIGDEETLDILRREMGRLAVPKRPRRRPAPPHRRPAPPHR